MTNTKGDKDRECVAQGVGNVVCGFFGALGGCAMIGQSAMNIHAGTAPSHQCLLSAARV